MSFSSVATGDNNTAIGTRSMFSNTSGSENTGLGKDALYSNTVGLYNTAVGEGALYSNVDGSGSVAVGRLALYTQDPASAVNMYNVGVGYDAGGKITTGIQKNTLHSVASWRCI